MENVFDAGKMPYVAADPVVPFTFMQNVALVLSTLLDIVTVLILSVPNWLEALFYVFFNRPKKSVVGQVVLVTGGGNGIGRAIAIELARHGCDIAIADIDHSAAMDTANELKFFKVNAKGYCIDVSDHKALKVLQKQIEIDLGPVDILVNNAGLIPLLSLREGTEKEIERIIKVNQTANYFTIRTFLPGMMDRRRGHIVQMSSMTAQHPMPGAVLYTSTKFAVRGYIEALAEEMRQEGYGDCIHLTSVHPYFVATRKDLMDAVDLRFPAITVMETARGAVEGMLRNELIVTIPKMNEYVTMLVRSLPRKNQHLVRDYITREKQSRMFKSPPVYVEDSPAISFLNAEM